MMYAYKIEIKTDPQEIRFIKEIELPDTLLTLDNLSKYVSKNETFYISEVENDNFSYKTILTIQGKRLETQKEVDERVKKQTKYMEGYYKHHAKYGKKK